MILKATKTGLLLCSTLVLMYSCKKNDVIQVEKTTETQSLRMGGLLPDDPRKLSRVPVIISSTYLQQQSMMMRKGGNNGVAPGTTGDLAKPSITITSPSDQSSVTGTVSISVNATDNVGVKTVKYFVDGTTTIGSSITTPFGISWNSGNLADGVHSITATAYDAAGNYSSSTIAVTKNTIVVTPPPSSSTQFSLNMPPVGYQGGEASCVAFAVGYAARSTELFYHTGGAAYDYTSNIFSPEFLYDMTKASSDCGSGSSVMVALDSLKTKGICTWQTMPYSYSDGCSVITNGFQLAEAANYKISDYSAILKSDVVAIKSALMNHHPVIFGVNLDNSFINAQPGFIWSSYTAAPGPGHAMVICGYDDSKNAWKVMNSWGTGWCENGYGWIDYNFFATTGSSWTFIIN